MRTLACEHPRTAVGRAVGVSAGMLSVALLGAACAVPAARGVRPLAVDGVTGGGTSASARGSLVPSPVPGVDSSAAPQILSAWRSAEQAFESAAQTADPTAPALLATTIDPQLSFTESLLASMRTSGETAHGPVDLGQPHVVASTGEEATVRSCLHDAEVVVGPGGDPVPGIAGQVATELVISLVVDTGGEWKLSDQSVRVVSCAT